VRGWHPFRVQFAFWVFPVVSLADSLYHRLQIRSSLWRPLQKSSAFKCPVRDVVKVAWHFSAGYAFKSDLVPEGRLKATSGKRVQASLRDARFLHEFPALKCRATFNRSYGTNGSRLLQRSLSGWPERTASPTPRSPAKNPLPRSSCSESRIPPPAVLRVASILPQTRPRCPARQSERLRRSG